MFDSWTKGARSLFDSVLVLYEDTNFAYAIAGWMTVVTVLLLAVAIVSHVMRVIAIKSRVMAITSFVSFNSSEKAKAGADDHEAVFASRFQDIDKKLREGGPLVSGLAHAWMRYRKTLTFISSPPIRSSQQPNAFFFSAMPPPAWLGFAANILVAVGLLATFLGLVAALSFAARGMASDDVNAMQGALRSLLAAASSKFITSVAGIGLSILLRLAERLITAHLRGEIDNLSSALEFGIRVDPDAHSAAIADRLNALLERPAAKSMAPAP